MGQHPMDDSDKARFDRLCAALQPLMELLGGPWGNVLYTHGLWTWRESSMFHKVQAAMRGQESEEDNDDSPITV